MIGKNSCPDGVVVIDIRPLMNGGKSGVEVYLEKILTEIFVSASDCDRYVLYCNGLKKINWSRFAWHKKAQIVQTRWPNKIFNLLIFLFQWPKIDNLIAQKIGKKVKVFFLPDLRPVALSVSKLVSVFHDLSFLRFPHFFSARARLSHLLLQPKKIALRSAKIIAVSRFTASEIIEAYGISATKIKIIPEGPGSVEKVSQKILSLVKNRYGLNDRFFVFVSSLEPRKNLSRIFAAFNLFRSTNPDYRLVFIGRGNSRIFQKVDLPSQSHFLYLGQLNDLEKSAIISLSRGLVYPSLYEGFGLPILESYSFDKPVIASNCGSLPEVTGRGGVLVDPLSVESILKGFFSLVDEEKYRNLKKQIPAQLAKFSWSKCAKATIETLRSISLSPNNQSEKY